MTIDEIVRTYVKKGGKEYSQGHWKSVMVANYAM